MLEYHCNKIATTKTFTKKQICDIISVRNIVENPMNPLRSIYSLFLIAIVVASLEKLNFESDRYWQNTMKSEVCNLNPL